MAILKQEITDTKTILQLAEEGKVNELRKIANLQELLNKNIVDGQNRTPLHLAAQRGHLEVVKLIVSLVDRSYLEKFDKMGYASMHRAALGGHENIIRYLAQQGANIDTQAPGGVTPLMVAARVNAEGENNNIAILKVFKELNADPEKVDLTSLNHDELMTNQEYIKILRILNIKKKSLNKDEKILEALEQACPAPSKKSPSGAIQAALTKGLEEMFRQTNTEDESQVKDSGMNFIKKI